MVGKTEVIGGTQSKNSVGRVECRIAMDDDRGEYPCRIATIDKARLTRSLDVVGSPHRRCSRGPCGLKSWACGGISRGGVVSILGNVRLFWDWETQILRTRRRRVAGLRSRCGLRRRTSAGTRVRKVQPGKLRRLKKGWCGTKRTGWVCPWPGLSESRSPSPKYNLSKVEPTVLGRTRCVMISERSNAGFISNVVHSTADAWRVETLVS